MSRPRLSNEALRWLEIVLAERFGHLWSLRDVPHGLELRLNGNEGCISFDAIQECFLEARPDLPFTRWHAAAEGWTSVLGDPLPAPGVASLPRPLIERNSNGYVVHYDVLRLTYWMLARVEEIGRNDLDSHERFPASSSHAYKHGYLDRPVVDEWLDLLGQVIRRQWPGITLKRHEFRIRVSHDVDQPSLYAFKPWRQIGRMMAGHILKRCDPKAFFTAPYVKLATRDRLIEADPYNTFDWLMDVSEANGLRSAFYFICGKTEPSKDPDYELGHPLIRNLLKHIHQRGHEIGLHPSYNTFSNPEALKSEADRLRSICEQEKIQQKEWGGRMHYLRWQQPLTMRAWANAGMDYDSTLGYADHAGFRCGTSHEYPAFDAESQAQLSLRIRPLIAMECTVIDEVYLGLGDSQSAEEVFLKLKESCHHVQGCFTLLWHNSFCEKNHIKNLYRSIAVNKINA